jgi:hypothetical protein
MGALDSRRWDGHHWPRHFDALKNHSSRS